MACNHNKSETSASINLNLEAIRNARPDKKAIAILFSGGLDSTLEAAGRLMDYSKVYLITFQNGLCTGCGAAERRANEIASLFGKDRIEYQLLDTSPLMKILLADWRKQWKEYHSPLIVDLACKMAGVTSLMIYARRQDITDISDGAAKAQTHIFVQHPDFTAHIRPWVESYGLKLVSPRYFHSGRPEKFKVQANLGLRTGWEALEKVPISGQKLFQPFCWWAFLSFFFTGPLQNLKIVRRYDLPIEKAHTLWNRNVHLAEEYMKTELERAPSSSAPATGLQEPA